MPLVEEDDQLVSLSFLFDFSDFYFKFYPYFSSVFVLSI